MLLQFNFKNHRSFRDKVSFDMSATKITEHPEHVVSTAKEKILRVAAIYGANASGKTNVYDAFDYMTYYIAESFYFGDDDNGRNQSSRRSARIKETPFLFDEKSAKNETLFEVFFTDSHEKIERIYQYGFVLKDSIVLEEWLYSKAKTASNYKTIFCRDSGNNEYDLSGIPPRLQENIKISLGKMTLILSLGAKLQVPKLKQVRDWFLKNEIVSFGDPVENLFRSSMIPQGFDECTDVQQKVVEYFSSFDDSIKGFEVEKIVVKEDNKDEGKYKIDTLHKMINSKDMAKLPLQEESHGTLKMFALFPYLQDVLKNGSVLFVDELNAKLHPLLVRNIILTFANPKLNTNNAQLIFTTHDTWQLSNDLMRRDEIWFTEKNSEGISNLYSLADFVDEDGDKIRKDENYEKNYLIGKYGAIPSLKTISTFAGANDEE